MRRIPFLPALLLVIGTCLLLPACGNDSGGGAAAPTKSSIVGTWALDAEAFVASVKAGVEKAAAGGDEEAAMAKAMFEMMEPQFKSATMDFTIVADGTWSMKGIMGGDPKEATGTWKQSGDQFAFTEESEADDSKKPLMGSLEGDALHLRPPADEAPPGMDFAFILRRK